MFSAIGSRTSGMCGRLKWTLPAMLLAASLLFGGCADDEEDAFASEGTAATPLNLDPIPVSHDGSVGTVASSYYFVNLTTTTINHTVALSGLTEDADMFVYGPGAFVDNEILCLSIQPGTSSEICTAILPPTPIYFQVKLIGEESTEFLLSVTEL